MALRVWNGSCYALVGRILDILTDVSRQTRIGYAKW
jgi:hypothetical protein